jgi:DNA-binding response OmpR family regulator
MHDESRGMTRILIIEDEAALQKALADNFRFESYEVVTAPDGETGYTLAKKRRTRMSSCWTSCFRG